jgi:hypothetical protein
MGDHRHSSELTRYPHQNPNPMQISRRTFQSLLSRRDGFLPAAERLSQPLRCGDAKIRQQERIIDGTITMETQRLANVQIQARTAKVEQTFGSMVAGNDG